MQSATNAASKLFAEKMGSLAGMMSVLLTLPTAAISARGRCTSPSKRKLQQAPLKMNTSQKKEEPNAQKGKDVEIKIVPEGTFAGTQDKPVLVKKGKPEPADTGNQGGGQN